MRKGFLKSVLALLAGAGLTTALPGLASAGGPIAHVSFEDADQVATPKGQVSSKHIDAQPTIIEENGSSGGQVVSGGDDEKAGAPGRIWASGEYLLWWIKGSHVPSLITTGPVSSLGILGAPGTTVVFGGPIINDDPMSGGRFTTGIWLDDDHTLGFETNYFFLGKDTDRFSVSSSGAPGSALLARPFLDVTTGLENSELNALPGILGSTKTITSSTRLQGTESNAICNLCCGCNARVDLLAGVRYMELEEGLGIVENVSVLPGVDFGFPFVGGNTLVASDQFSTQNRFYGGQIGGRAELRRGRMFVDMLGKVALGDTHQVVDINGLTVITTPAGGVTRATGGLLALSSNIGRHTRDQFAVIPEVGMTVGYQVTDHLRAFVGYNFIYWSNVVRPADQIDRGVNPTLVPTSLPFGAPGVGPARPAFVFRDTDFWAQGVSFGLEFNY